MICTFSAFFFFLFQTFVPEFSGIFLLGFMIPIFYANSFRFESNFGSKSFLNLEILQPFYFLIFLLIIASFLTICMPNEFLNDLACIFVSFLAIQISLVQKENPNLSILLFLFTCLAIYLSLLESSGLAVLAFAFAIRAQNLKLTKVLLFIGILFFLINSLANASNLENFEPSIANIFQRRQVDSYFILGCLIYFIVDWIRYFRTSSMPFYKTDFLFYFTAYIGLYLLNEPIFSVFLFFSSLPMATKRKK